jgi:metal-responsive CopG/Arc/MetJ family transcriptional regulator
MATAKNGKKSGAKTQRSRAMRASVSFPKDLYGGLGAIARKKKVSLAWVVRDATERYVADETGAGSEGKRGA